MLTPLKNTAQWSPFRLDALGLLTMLGGPEMSHAVGRLTFNRFTEYLPLLGAYTIPSNDFTRPLCGFTLYNITDAIVSTSFSGWFSRWLLAQDASAKTVFIWSVYRQQPPRRCRAVILAAVIGIVVNCITTLIPVLLGDWYGFASAMSVNTSIFVRWYLVSQNRQAIDHAAKLEDSRRSPDVVKILCFLADNKVVTVFAPRNVVINCFLTTPQPSHPRFYGIVRALGWFSFAGFVVTIGQATLIVQLITVSLTLMATVLTARGTGSYEMSVGSKLRAWRSERPNVSGRRIETYTQLDLSQEEENTLVDWALVPQRRNTKWWQEYYTLRATAKSEELYTQDAFKELNREVCENCLEEAHSESLHNKAETTTEAIKDNDRRHLPGKIYTQQEIVSGRSQKRTEQKY